MSLLQNTCRSRARKRLGLRGAAQVCAAGAGVRCLLAVDVVPWARCSRRSVWRVPARVEDCVCVCTLTRTLTRPRIHAHARLQLPASGTKPMMMAFLSGQQPLCVVSVSGESGAAMTACGAAGHMCGKSCQALRVRGARTCSCACEHVPNERVHACRCVLTRLHAFPRAHIQRVHSGEASGTRP